MTLKSITKPVINLLNGTQRHKWYDEQLALHTYCKQFDTKRDYVAFHKQKLGQQLTCFNGEYRYWVWEGQVKVSEHHTAMWRVFISNKKGICFEVDTGRVDAAMMCWNDYKSKIGMTY